MLRELVATTEQQQASLQAAVQGYQAENDKLRLLIQRLLRQQFGRRSEQLSADQLQLALEDLEQAIAANEAAQEAAALRRDGKPTVPSTLAREREANPFLRAPDEARLAELRAAKDNFR